MAIQIHDTLTLMKVQEAVKPVDSYWLDLCFPSVQLFETAKIFFDDIGSERPIAPFVSPLVQGRVMKDQGFQTKTFAPAYVKPKHRVDPTKVLRRTAGEAIGGSISPEQRVNAAIAENMKIEAQMIKRRFEVMAASAIIHGSVTVVGEDYPEVNVDFGRDAGQSVVLTGTTRWDSSVDVDMIGDINDWMEKTFDLSGYAPTRITVSPRVWSLMSKNKGIIASLNKDFAGQKGALNLGVGTGAESQYKGTLSEGLEVYTHKGLYDEGVVRKATMPDGGVVFTSSAVDGVRCFGAIMNMTALYAAEMFPTMWPEKDPSGLFTMTESAPLMVPAMPNATLYVNVLG